MFELIKTIKLGYLTKQVGEKIKSNLIGERTTNGKDGESTGGCGVGIGGGEGRKRMGSGQEVKRMLTLTQK